jgi:hypothetical protein
MHDSSRGRLMSRIERERRSNGRGNPPDHLDSAHVAGRNNTLRSLPCDTPDRVLDCKTSVKIAFL